MTAYGDLLAHNRRMGEIEQEYLDREDAAARLKRKERSALADEQIAHDATREQLASITDLARAVVEGATALPSEGYRVPTGAFDALAEALGLSMRWPIELKVNAEVEA